jgi:putative tryptophan/tyrosine transport system substrate-binding protein
MERREFVGGLTLGLLASPLVAEAQEAGKVARIGVIGPGSSQTDQAGELLFRVFDERLQALGYVGGRNVIFDRRWPEGRLERLQRLAQDLTAADVDIIVAWSTPAVAAAKHAATRIPIVMASSGDAVATGLVESLSHPGGNVTGVSWQLGELATKWLEMMIELRPRAKRILVLWDSTSAPDISARPRLQTAAALTKTQLDFAEARDADEYELALRAGAKHRATGVIVFPNVRAYIHKTHIAAAALKNRLPTVHGFREFVHAGGLIAYTPSQNEMARQAARYVDRIIRGAKPADLPVEQPTKFELIVNLKTARTLGLTIPPPLLLRADEVIQ